MEGVTKEFTKEEVKMWLKVLVKELPVHKTSPETKALINDLKQNIQGHMTKELFKSEMTGLKELFGEKLENIIKQTKKTNGKLADQEKKIQKNTLWRVGLIFAWSVVTFLFPTLFYYYTKSLQADINLQIKNEISQYIEMIEE